MAGLLRSGDSSYSIIRRKALLLGPGIVPHKYILTRDAEKASVPHSSNRKNEVPKASYSKLNLPLSHLHEIGWSKISHEISRGS